MNALVDTLLPPRVQVIKRRGDPNIIRESFFFNDGGIQKLRVTFEDGMEAYFPAQGLRCDAEKVAP